MPTVTTPEPYIESILYTTTRIPFKRIYYIIFTSPCTCINFLFWNIKSSIICSLPALPATACTILSLTYRTPATPSFFFFSSHTSSSPSLHRQFLLSRMLFPRSVLGLLLLAFLSLMSLLRDVYSNPSISNHSNHLPFQNPFYIFCTAHITIGN